jgi:hypothetical protein
VAESDTKTSGEQDAEGSAQKFSRERLETESQRLLGLPGFVVAGALTDVKGHGDLTLDQVHSAVAKYHKKEA